MNKMNATWNDLYEHTAKMSEEERKMPVLIWGEERPLCKVEDELEVALEAGRTYLFGD